MNRTNRKNKTVATSALLNKPRWNQLAGRTLILAAAGLAVAGTLALPRAARAATDTWAGTGSTTFTNNWNLGTNWSSNPSVPGAADTALFNSAPTNTAPTLSASSFIGNITFDTSTAAAYNIGGGGFNLTLSNSGTVQITGTVVNAQTISAPLILGGNGTFNNLATSSSATLNVSGSITGSAATGSDTLTLAGTNTGANTLSGVIGDGTFGGNVALAVSGGSWTLSAANTYTGGTTVTSGTLDLTGSLASTGNLTVNGGTFQVNNGAGQTIAALGGTGGTINLAATTDNLTVNSGGSFAGAISGAGGLNLAGGTLTLSGANTYTGGTTLTSGTLDLTGSLASTGNLTVNGGTFKLDGGAAQTVAALNSTSTGAIDLVATTDVLTATGGGTVAGVVSGLGGLTVNGGTLTLSNANTYTGGTTLTSGTLSISAANNLGTGGITLNGGTLLTTAGITDSATVGLGVGGGTISDGGNSDTFSGVFSGGAGTGVLTLTGGGTLTLSGVNTYSGGTIIDAPTIVIFTNSSSLGSGSVTLGPGGGELEAGATGITLGNNIVLSDTLASGTPDIYSTGSASFTDTLSGIISDAAGVNGGLEITGGGTLILNPTSGGLSVNNTYSGGTTVNGATLVIDSSNALGSTLVANELTNNVNLTNAATLETNNGLGAIGTGITINVGGNYTQSANSTLLLTFSGTAASGNYDFVKLVNNQSAALNGGTLKAEFAPGFTPKDFDVYTVVKTTGSVASNFSTPLDITPNNANHSEDHVLALFAGHNATGETMTVQTDFLSFPSVLTPNERSVATYLNTYATPANTPPNLQTLLSQLSQLPAVQFGPALDQLTPQAEQAMGNLGIENGIFESQTVFSQISNQFNGMTGFNAAGLSMLDTPNADPFTTALDSAMQSVAQANNQNATSSMDVFNGEPSQGGAVPVPGRESQRNTLSGFVSGNIILANLPGTAIGHANFTTGGVITGVDYNMASHLVIGALFSYAYTGAKLDNAGSALQDNSYSPGIYLGFRKHGFYVDALGSYTYNAYTMHRNITFTAPESVASSSPHSNQFDLNAMAGYNFHLRHGLKLGPAVGVGYTHMNISGYTETGSAADLTVSPMSVDSLRSLVGGRIEYAWHPAGLSVPVDFSANAFWQHEFLNGSRGITASFTELGTGSFVIDTAGPERDSALLGAGVSGNLTRNITLFVNYESQLGPRSMFAQSVLAGVAIALR
jgi:autotransporter-associated beta strand protein